VAFVLNPHIQRMVRFAGPRRFDSINSTTVARAEAVLTERLFGGAVAQLVAA